MHVAMFSAKSYDRTSFDLATGSDNVTLTFIDQPLSPLTAPSCKGYDAVCVFVNDDVSHDTVAALADAGVKHIALRCAGYNNVDLDAARQCDIRVSRVPAYSPQTVAEHALALMLTLNRKTHKAYNRVKEGNFAIEGLMGFTMAGKTAGIIGAGRIGMATASLLQGFGCRVVCYDPFVSDDSLKQHATFTDLDTLLSDSHIISLHCPLTEDSYHMINHDSIAKMRDNVMLINTSRGGLIDTRAVIAGLKTGKIGYLGLDVYEMESELFFRDHSLEIIQDDDFQRLASFHNVLITGHQGFFTREALDEIATTTINNLVAVHHGQDNGNLLT
ncbi:2-hydroxyacid dehydrogenase [Alteromonas sp. CYL-A6]|uniref:2-hydroxyacid dehydrogenase n=1 Tax=Alteromonas nitratireducens TaxID=3390813 RepID=UPI0034BB64B5